MFDNSHHFFDSYLNFHISLKCFHLEKYNCGSKRKLAKYCYKGFYGTTIDNEHFVYMCIFPTLIVVNVMCSDQKTLLINFYYDFHAITCIPSFMSQLEYNIENNIKKIES